MLKYDIRKMHTWPFPIRLIVLVIILIIILILGYFFDVESYQNSITASIQQQEDLKRQLKLIVEKRVAAENSISEFPALKKMLADWETKIATKEEQRALLDDILKLGEQLNLNILNFDPDKEVKDDLYYQLPVAISAQGTYDQIAEYVSQIANMPKLIGISTFTITQDLQSKAVGGTASASSSNTALSSDTILTGQINIEVYRK